LARLRKREGTATDKAPSVFNSIGISIGAGIRNTGAAFETGSKDLDWVKDSQLGGADAFDEFDVVDKGGNLGQPVVVGAKHHTKIGYITNLLVITSVTFVEPNDKSKSGVDTAGVGTKNGVVKALFRIGIALGGEAVPAPGNVDVILARDTAVGL